MKTTCIYIINSKLKPKRFYIGSAVNFKGRKSVHISQLLRGNHHSKKLQRHVNKYGINDLVFSVISEVEKKSLLIEEQKYLDLLTPYFNINKIAGSNLGRKFGPMKQAHKNKIAKGNKGKKVSQSTIDLQKVKMNKYTIDGVLVKTYNSGIEAIEAEGIQVRNSRNNNLTIGGYVWVSEGAELPDFSEIKNRLNECKKVRCKPVMQIDRNGNLVEEFEGVRIAFKKTGIDHRSIAQVASGSKIRKTAGGFVWKYKEPVK